MHRIPIVLFLPKRNLLTHFQTPPPNPNVSSPFHSHNTGLRTTLGRHLILINCPLFPTCLASKATPNGGPMRWTQGLGIPRCVYEFNRSARYDVDGIRFTGRTALRCLEMEGNEEFESRRSVGRDFVGPTASRSCKDRIKVRRCRKRGRYKSTPDTCIFSGRKVTQTPIPSYMLSAALGIEFWTSRVINQRKLVRE